MLPHQHTHLVLDGHEETEVLLLQWGGTEAVRTLAAGDTKGGQFLLIKHLVTLATVEEWQWDCMHIVVLWEACSNRGWMGQE